MKNIFLFFLIVLGCFFQSATVFRSGLRSNEGMGFWGANVHDGIWHLSLINQLLVKVPPDNPVFSGEVLKSYHWGYDFLAATVSKITHLSPADVHFRLLPIFFSIFLGITSFLLATNVFKNFWAGFWFAFLNYFGGSLGWLVTLFRYGRLDGESVFWSMQSISFLLNLPYVISLVFLFLGFYFLEKLNGKGKLLLLFLISLIFGLLLNIKVYAALLFFISFGSVIVFDFFLERKIEKERIFVFFFSIFTALVVLITLHNKSNFPFIFSPLWFIRTMFEAGDRLFIYKLGEMWWALQNSWYRSPKFLALALFGILVFVVGNLGTRIFGFVRVFPLKKNNSFLKKFFGFLFLWGSAIPLFLIQKGTAWNTIQFFYYALVAANWFFADFLAELTKKRKFLLLFIFLFPILPTNFGTLKNYFSSLPTAYISTHELSGLDFLRNQENGIVLTFPYDQFAKNSFVSPLPVYVYETTAYVSAFSQKKTYLEDEMNLEITGYNWQDRKKEVQRFFQARDKAWARGFLLNNRIDYLYLVGSQTLTLSEEDLGLKMIFSNQEVKIYRVLK